MSQKVRIFIFLLAIIKGSLQKNKTEIYWSFTNTGGGQGFTNIFPFFSCDKTFIAYKWAICLETCKRWIKKSKLKEIIQYVVPASRTSKTGKTFDLKLSFQFPPKDIGLSVVDWGWEWDMLFWVRETIIKILGEA